MKEPEHNDRFIQQLRATLDQSVESLDDAALRDLHRARHKALAAHKSRPAWLLPMGGLAAAATLAAFSVSLWMASPSPSVNAPMPALEDLALLEDSEALEFYEDLDFYLWLDSEEDAS